MSRYQNHPGTALVAFGFLLALSASVSAQPLKARITQVNRDHFPRITVFVSITDDQGKPVSKPLTGNLVISEGKQAVHQAALITGPKNARSVLAPVSVVLVLDLSGSMQGEKLEKAKVAAIAYVDLSPKHFQIALVTFSNSPSTVCGFTTDKDRLRTAIKGLSISGNTALQDGIGSGLDLVRGRDGRRALVTLTDGQENSSKRYVGDVGRGELLRRATDEGCSVSVVGLGSDVDAATLKNYEQTGGFYLFAPNPDQLRGTFERLEEFLQSEWSFEYQSPAAEADGGRRELSVQLTVDGLQIDAPPVRFVAPGVLPNVRSEHSPYFLALMGLIVAPQILLFVGRLASVAYFRTRWLGRVRAGSPHLTQRDPNSDRGGPLFVIGDPVVECPGCHRAHHQRSWRNNTCRCLGCGQGSGRCCYPSVLPRRLRLVLDRLLRRSTGEGGRRCLCRCAGDMEGY